MDNTELIAGLAGPLLAAVAFAILVNRKALLPILDDAGRNPGLIVFSGLLTLVAGLAIVRVHNIWSTDWKGLVTLIGWLAVIGGLARIIVPDRIAAVHNGITRSPTLLTTWCLVALSLGLYLTAKAYNVIS